MENKNYEKNDTSYSNFVTLTGALNKHIIQQRHL